MAGKGKTERFWPLREGGPYDKPGESREMYKCIGCGAETYPEKGWNGEPDKHQCKPGCTCQSDLIQGNSRQFRQNFDRIFPNAPGAGL